LTTYNTQVDSSRTRLHIKEECITVGNLLAIKHNKAPRGMIKKKKKKKHVEIPGELLGMC